MDPFTRLEQLLAQDQFELLLEEEQKEPDRESNRESERDKTEISGRRSRKKRGDNRRNIRLVYLMNDAVESFLIFESAVLTGTYQADYEGELEAKLEFQNDPENPYILIVHQGNSVVTIFFKNLEFEYHLYDYGEIAHFWVSGYEYLRQLEYRIAILRDKYEYLGPNFCTKEERKLVALVNFPPLNYTNYPAVPDRYLVPQEDPWIPSEQAIAVMEELAEEAGDHSFRFWLKLYRRFPYKMVARFLAMLLHTNAHAELIDLLDEKLNDASEIYPERDFKEPGNQDFRMAIKTAMEKARERQSELEEQGIYSVVLREEPFESAKDSIGFTAYLMIWRPGLINRKTEIEKWEVNG